MIQKLWNYTEQYILITFDIQTQLTVDVSFGIKQHNEAKIQTKWINHIIFTAKLYVSISKRKKKKKD